MFVLNFDIGWAGSIHDANLWARTEIGQLCEAWIFSPYALVGDVAYPCRPWMLVPSRATKIDYHGCEPNCVPTF